MEGTEEEGGAEAKGGGGLTKQTNRKNTNTKLKHKDLNELMSERTRLKCDWNAIKRRKSIRR